MKTICALYAAACCLSATHTLAEQPPPYDKGHVWMYTEIKTKDGHFNDYMKWVASDFKTMSEAQKAKGILLDYKVFVVNAPRQGEPDVILAREYPNMAVFDRSTEEDYALQTSIVGSVAAADQKQAARTTIREQVGQVLMREIKLK